MKPETPNQSGTPRHSDVGGCQGNSDVYDDMAEILGIKKPDVEDWVLSDAAPSAKLCKRLDKLHKEMETVLQILVRNPEGISPGRYEKEKYDANWRRAE